MSLNKNVALLQALGLSPYDEHSPEEIQQAREQLCRILRVSIEVSDETLIQLEHDSMEHLSTSQDDAVKNSLPPQPNFELVSQTQAEVLPRPNFEIVQEAAREASAESANPVRPNLDVFAQLPANRQFIQDTINPEELRDIVRTKISTTPVEVEAVPQPRSTFTGLKSVSAHAADEEAAALEPAIEECSREAKIQSKNSLRNAMQMQRTGEQPDDKPFFAKIFDVLKPKRDR